MKLETFFEKFDQLADAPDAIPAMRELVIQLAVRGHLTERIGGESSKAQLALADEFRVRRAKREKPDAEDVPFPIPENWGWVAVGDSMDMFNGRAFKPEEWSTEGTPIIRIQNLNNEHAAFNRCNADLDPKIHVHDGEFLISWSGTPGTSFGAFIWNRGFAYLNQHIFRCELVKGVFEKAFLRMAINARLDEMISHAQGAVGLRHITKGKLESIRLPLPPLTEQKRIVAKVDELMALCDRLEVQQQERETRHAALARASLARFADAPTPANLGFIFHPSYTIPPADLRKAILTLAIDGSLIKAVSKETQFGEVVDLLGGYAFKSEWFTKSSGIRLVRNQNISHGELDWRETEYLPNDRAHEFEKWALRAGDLVLSLNRPFISTGLKLAWITDADCPCLLVQRIVCLRPDPQRLLAKYLYLWCNAPHFYRDAHVVPSSGVPYIAPNRVAQMKMQLPPLAEQRRIVAKVEQLMALVDRLETQLAASRTTAAKLLEALVAELTTPKRVVKRPVSDPTTYLVQLIPAVLKELKRPLALDQLNAAIALLFLPEQLLPLVESTSGMEARFHFANFAQPNKEGCVNAAVQLLTQTKTLHYPESDEPVTLHFNPAKMPPIDPVIAMDAKYLAAIIDLVPAAEIEVKTKSASPKTVKKALLNV